MIFHKVRNGSPVPESFCHKIMMDSRKRRELRRVKLLNRTKPTEDPVISPDCDVGLKYKRWKCTDTGFKEPILIPEALVDPATEPTYGLQNIKKKFGKLKSSLRRQGEAVGGALTLNNGVACGSHGSVSVIGRRRTMEDAVAVELGFSTRGTKTYDFFGVYDGHGGFRVAESCRETLHKLVAKIVEEEKGGGEVDWGKVMAAGFRKMDEEVDKYGAEVEMMGSTAVVAVVWEKEVVVAHCGDSRAVISRGGVSVQLSDDHKPDRPDELERIIGCGGEVINWNGQRVLGVLATSRSIGDKCLEPFVIPDPEVKVINTTDLDEFLILASDGLWDVFSNDLACQVVRKCLNGRINVSSVVQQDTNPVPVDKRNQENYAAVAATVLVELAMARGSRDNISVIVVDLRHLESSNQVST